MQTRYPAAEWRPLGKQTEPGITPRILIFHTMVGYLRGVDSQFRASGYTGTESTFGVGGPRDGQALDGAVWQWQDLTHQADAQFAGNDYANSVETSDGGDPGRPWSAKQLAALIALTVWWCRQTGAPCRLVRSTSDRGIGYHRQFPAWNPDLHSCPGDVRLTQLVDHIIPTAARELAAPPTPVPAPAPTPAPAIGGQFMEIVVATDSAMRWLWNGSALVPTNQSDLKGIWKDLPRREMTTSQAHQYYTPA